MTLVVGATGVLGFEVCRRLHDEGHSVRGFIRPGSARESALVRLGVDTCHGDLKDIDSVRRACLGQDTIVSTATCTTSQRPGDTLRSVDRDGQIRLIEAARDAGVRRFVYVSVSPNASPRSELVTYKRDVENRLRASGMDWVILQPSAFMEIWLSPRIGWDFERGRARIIGAGTRPVSLVSVADVASFCVLAATRDALTGRSLPIGGPEAVTPLQIVARAESISGRPIRVQRVPAAVMQIVSRVLRPFAPVPASLIALGVHSAQHGDAIDMTSTAREFAITLTPVSEHLRRVLQPHLQ